MKRLSGLWLAFVGTLWPCFANATIELDYYTYNAFDETVAAFQRLALIFSNSGFLVFVTIFAVFGVVIGALTVASRGVAGEQVSPTSWLIPIAAGMIVFRALLIPTGTLHVYDPVRNTYQAVPDVPDLVVLLAGGLNKVERGIIEIIDASSATPYSDNAGAISFNLLLSALGGSVESINLERSMSRYFEDCAIPAMALGYNGMSMQVLRRGSTDLYDTYANFAHPSLYTVWYPDGNDAGVAGTCLDAWNFMSPLLSSTATFDGYRETICVKAGFNAGDPAQMARCETEIASATSFYGVGAASSVPFLRSAVLAKSMSDAMNTANFSIQQRRTVDRQIMAEGFGSAEAMNQWVPKLRGYMIAMAVGLVPLCCLFLVTPLFRKSLMFTIGVFLWVTAWGITDAMSAQQAADAARAAFEEISRFGLSYDAIMSTPEAAVQALGIFSKARTQALMLSTALCAALFSFGGYALSNLASNWQHHLDQAGERAGRQTHLPEERAALQQSMISSLGPQAALAAGGFQTAAFSSASPGMRAAHESSAYIGQSLTGGNYPSTTVAMEGRIDGGARVGNVAAMESVATRNNESVVGASTRITEFDRRGSATSSTMDQKVLKDAYQGDEARGLELRGAQRGGDTVASDETYRYLNGPGDVAATGAIELGRLGRASEIGLSKTGNADRAIGRFATEHQKHAFYAETLREQGATGLTGKMGAMEEVARAQGTAMALDEVSVDGLAIGQKWGQLRGAAAGAASEEVGATEIFQSSRTALSNEIAASRLAYDTARFLGLDPHRMSELISTQGARQQAHVQLAVGSENMGFVLDRLEQANLLAPETIESLRNKDGFVVDTTFNEAGDPISVVLTAGNRTLVMNQTSVSEGFSAVRTDTTRTEIGHSIQGGLALLEPKALQMELLEAANGDVFSGELDEQRLYAIAGAFNSAYREQGYSANAVSTESDTWRTGVSAHVGVSGQASTPGAKFGIPSATVSGGIQSSGGWDRHDGDVRNTVVELGVDQSAEMLIDARREAVARYETEHGAGSAATADQSYLAQAWAELAIERANAFTNQQALETEGAIGKHDVVQDLPEERPEYPKPPDLDITKLRW